MGLKRILYLSFFLALATVCPAKEITVMCAMGIKEAVKQAALRFERDTGQKVIVVAASSGLLAKQIEGGVSWDLFISASPFWTDYLKKRMPEKKVEAFATTKLVLITHPSSTIKDIQDICGKRIAIGDQRFAPFGKYGLEALKKTGLYRCVANGLIPAAHTQQAVMWTITESVDAAIVYLSDFTKFKSLVRVVYIFPENTHSKIIFTAMWNSIKGKCFLDYLKRSKDILNGYGFEPADR